MAARVVSSVGYVVVARDPSQYEVEVELKNLADPTEVHNIAMVPTAMEGVSADVLEAGGWSVRWRNKPLGVSGVVGPWHDLPNITVTAPAPLPALGPLIATSNALTDASIAEVTFEQGESARFYMPTWTFPNTDWGQAVASGGAFTVEAQRVLLNGYQGVYLVVERQATVGADWVEEDRGFLPLSLVTPTPEDSERIDPRRTTLIRLELQQPRQHTYPNIFVLSDQGVVRAINGVTGQGAAVRYQGYELGMDSTATLDQTTTWLGSMTDGTTIWFINRTGGNTIIRAYSLTSAGFARVPTRDLRFNRVTTIRGGVWWNNGFYLINGSVAERWVVQGNLVDGVQWALTRDTSANIQLGTLANAWGGAATNGTIMWVMGSTITSRGLSWGAYAWTLSTRRYESSRAVSLGPNPGIYPPGGFATATHLWTIEALTRTLVSWNFTTKIPGTRYPLPPGTWSGASIASITRSVWNIGYGVLSSTLQDSGPLYGISLREGEGGTPVRTRVRIYLGPGGLGA